MPTPAWRQLGQQLLNQELDAKVSWESIWNLTDAEASDVDYTSDVLSVAHRQWFRGLCAVGYGILAIAGLAANAVFCLVIWRSRQLHTVTHLLMTNLAVSNLLFLLFHPAFFMTTYIIQTNWSLGTVMCKASISIVYLTATGSFYFMSAVAIDRWLALFRRRQRLNRRRGRWLTLAVWLISLTVASPYLWLSREMPVLHNELEVDIAALFGERVQCAIDCRHCKRVLQITTIIVQYLIPLLIMVPAYGHMAIFLWRRTPIGAQSREKHRRARERRRRMLSALLAVLCWSPLFAVGLLHSYGIISGDSLMLYIGTSGIALLGILLTPSLYLLNDAFRSQLLSLVPCWTHTPPTVIREATRDTSDEEKTRQSSPMLPYILGRHRSYQVRRDSSFTQEPANPHLNHAQTPAPDVISFSHLNTSNR